MTSRDRDEPFAGAAAPGPDEPANDLERARASSFSERVDAVVEGGVQLPAMAPEERTLVETAAAIRAGVVGEVLAPSRVARIIEDAFEHARDEPAQAPGEHSSESVDADKPQALGERAAASSPAPSAAAAGESRSAASASGEASGQRGRSPKPRQLRRPMRKALPWLAAALAASAAAILAHSRASPPPDASAHSIPEQAQSRPADDLIGTIPEERAGQAGPRADAIFADRLGGYRKLRWSEREGGAR